MLEQGTIMKLEELPLLNFVLKRGKILIKLFGIVFFLCKLVCLAKVSHF